MSLRSYETILETYYEYRDRVYFQCRYHKISASNTYSALPLVFDLPKDKCVNLDKLRKGILIRYFWRPFTYNKKLCVEVQVDGEWIPIYHIRRKRAKYMGDSKIERKG